MNSTHESGLAPAVSGTDRTWHYLAMPFSKRVEIRWADMDAFRHVNNATYLSYLEEVRDEWLVARIGAEATTAFVLARVAIDYRSSVTQDDDEVEVSLELVRVGRSSVTTRELVVVPHDGRLAAEADAVLVHVDWTTGAAIPIDDGLRAALTAG